jgi:hypothetical protein
MHPLPKYLTLGAVAFLALQFDAGVPWQFYPLAVVFLAGIALAMWGAEGMREEARQAHQRTRGELELLASGYLVSAVAAVIWGALILHEEGSTSPPSPLGASSSAWRARTSASPWSHESKGTNSLPSPGGARPEPSERTESDFALTR